MKVKCEVIQDLLPLYYDEVCSEASQVLVEEHLEHCENCKKELQLIKGEFDVSPVQLEKQEVVKVATSNWKKLKYTFILKGICIAVLCVCFMILGYISPHLYSTVEENDEIGLMTQAMAYLECGELSMELKTKEDAYFIVTCKDGDNNRYVCVYEKDEVFKNRWHVKAGKKVEVDGEIHNWQYEIGTGDVLVIFYGFELSEARYNIRFENIIWNYMQTEQEMLKGFYMEDVQIPLDIQEMKVEGEFQ